MKSCPSNRPHLTCCLSLSFLCVLCSGVKWASLVIRSPRKKGKVRQTLDRERKTWQPPQSSLLKSKSQSSVSLESSVFSLQSSLVPRIHIHTHIHACHLPLAIEITTRGHEQLESSATHTSTHHFSTWPVAHSPRAPLSYFYICISFPLSPILLQLAL